MELESPTAYAVPVPSEVDSAGVDRRKCQWGECDPYEGEDFSLLLFFLFILIFDWDPQADPTEARVTSDDVYV